jgi:hypothetical protein
MMIIPLPAEKICAGKGKPPFLFCHAKQRRRRGDPSGIFAADDVELQILSRGAAAAKT